MLSRCCPSASVHRSVIITLISNRFADCPRVNWIFQLEAATLRLAWKENVAGRRLSFHRSIVAREQNKKGKKEKKNKKEQEREKGRKRKKKEEKKWKKLENGGTAED